MLDRVLKLAFVASFIGSEAIRAPHRWRNTRNRLEKRVAVDRRTGQEIALMTLGFLGMQAIPFFYVLTPRLRQADYRLPAWMRVVAGAKGAALSMAGLWLLWRSHVDLGRNWSPTVEIKEEQSLVTNGVYKHVRHPIYAAVWMLAAGQALLLQNWIAGLSGLVAFLPIYRLRVPQEEKMMLEHFGEEYRAYMERTGGVLPRLRG